MSKNTQRFDDQKVIKKIQDLARNPSPNALIHYVELLEKEKNLDSIILEMGLYAAAENGRPETVQYLLNKRALPTNYDTMGAEGGTPLLVNMLRKVTADRQEAYQDTFKLLLPSFTTHAINEKERKTGTTVLHEMAAKRWFSDMDHVISHIGAHVNVEDNTGKTPLHYAIQGTTQELRTQEKALRSTKAHLSSSNLSRIEPDKMVQFATLQNERENNFSFVAENLRQEMQQTVKTLLDCKADLNAQDAAKQTPLMYAAQGGHLEAMQLLLTRGANPLLRDAKGKMAKDYAKKIEDPTLRKACCQLLNTYKAEHATLAKAEKQLTSKAQNKMSKALAELGKMPLADLENPQEVLKVLKGNGLENYFVNKHTHEIDHHAIDKVINAVKIGHTLPFWHSWSRVARDTIKELLVTPAATASEATTTFTQRISERKSHKLYDKVFESRLAQALPSLEIPLKAYEKKWSALSESARETIREKINIKLLEINPALLEQMPERMDYHQLIYDAVTKRHSLLTSWKDIAKMLKKEIVAYMDKSESSYISGEALPDMEASQAISKSTSHVNRYKEKRQQMLNHPSEWRGK